MATKRAWAAVAIIAIVVVLLILAYGFYAGLFAVKPSAGGGAASGVWRVSFVKGDEVDFAGMTNVATITIVPSADGKSVDAYDTAAHWATVVGGTDTFIMESHLENLNTGDKNQVYSADIRVASVSSVTDQNAGTSASLVKKD